MKISISLAMSAAVAVALFFSLFGAGVVSRFSHSREKFSSAEWKAHDLRHRFHVATEVRAEHIKTGMKPEEILAMLGRPDAIDHRRWSYRADYSDTEGVGHFAELAIYFELGSGGVKRVVLNQ